LTEIKLKKGEPVEKALRRLKKKIDREGTLKEVRNHRRFEKPSEKRRRKLKVAKFTAMLRATPTSDLRLPLNAGRRFHPRPAFCCPRGRGISGLNNRRAAVPNEPNARRTPKCIRSRPAGTRIGTRTAAPCCRRSRRSGLTSPN
jgi:small subunit ribosomal protein S21